MTRTEIDTKIKETAPRGTRNISLRSEDTQAGYALTFISPYHDVPVTIHVDYETVQIDEEWWANIINEIRDKEGFDKARQEYLSIQDRRASRELLHCVAYYGMKTRPDLFDKQGAFSIGTLSNGNLEIGPYEINGPEARYAMTIPLETPITDHFGETYTHGDPEILTSLWKEI